MRSPSPLDPRLGRVFRVGDARAAGVPEKRLRARDLGTPFHGIRTTRGVSAVEAYSARLRRGDRFSHTTAARLWGAPVPSRHEAELHVTAALAQRPRTTGCIGHVSPDARFTRRMGLPVSEPARMLIECAALLDFEDVVAIADYLVLDPRILDPHDLRPHVTREALGEQLTSAGGYGVRMARRAHAACREGVESPMETRLRLLLSRAGLPEPVCGFELRGSDGSSVGWFDLAWPDRRVIAEYDGDQHRTSTSQYDRDIRRFDQAAERGWKVIRVRVNGIVRAPHETVARVARALG